MCMLNDSGHVIMNDGCCCFRPEKIEIGKVMSLQQVKQKIPSALFSWSLYTGSHEGLSTNLTTYALIASQSPSRCQPIYCQNRYHQPICAIFKCSASADTFFLFGMLNFVSRTYYIFIYFLYYIEMGTQDLSADTHLPFFSNLH